MTSPICTVQDGAGSPQSTLNGVDVTPGNTITIALQDTAGVNSWSLTLFGQDDMVVPPVVTVNNLAKTATFTAPASPWSLLYKSTVNNGIDAQGRNDPTLSTTFKICALTSQLERLAATNETSENSAAYGWVPILNDPIRQIDAVIAGGGGGGGGVPTFTADENILKGQAVRTTGSGHVSLAKAVGHKIAGVALTNITSGTTGPVQLIGPVSTSVASLGAGLATAVGANSSGTLVRASDATCATGLNYLGYCDTLGVVTAQPRTDFRYNALDYGLDNTGTNDNVAANAAMWALVPAGGECYYPAGTYRFNSTIGPAPEGLKICGAGNASDTPTYSGTKFYHYGAGTAFRVVNHPLDQGGGGQHIKDIAFISQHSGGEDSFQTPVSMGSTSTVSGGTYNGSVQVHLVAHGLGNGSRVHIAGCSNSGANGSWYIRATSPDDFILFGSTSSGTSTAGSGTIAYHDVPEIGLECLGGGNIHIEHCSIAKFKWNLSFDGTEQGYASYCFFGSILGTGYTDRDTDFNSNSGFDVRSGTFRFDPVNGPISETSTIELSNCVFDDHYYGWMSFDCYQFRVLNGRIDGAAWCVMVGGQNNVIDSCESDAVTCVVNMCDFIGIAGGIGNLKFSNNFWSLNSSATNSWKNTATGIALGLQFLGNTWIGRPSYPAVIPHNSVFFYAPISHEGSTDIINSNWTLLDTFSVSSGGNNDFTTINHNSAPRAMLDVMLNNYSKPLFIMADTNDVSYLQESLDSQVGAFRSFRTIKSGTTFDLAGKSEQVLDYLDLGIAASPGTFGTITSPHHNSGGYVEATVNVHDFTNQHLIGTFKLRQQFETNASNVVSLLGTLSIESHDSDGGLTDPLFVASGATVSIQLAAHATVPTNSVAVVTLSWRGHG